LKLQTIILTSALLLLGTTHGASAKHAATASDETHPGAATSARQSNSKSASRKTNSADARDLQTLLKLFEQDERHKCREWYHAHKNIEHDPKALVVHGLNSMNVGWLEPAFGSTHEAAQREPNNPYILASFAYVLDKKGNATDAMQFAKRALELKTDARTLAIMAEILETQGQSKKANDALKQATALDKNNFDLAAAKSRIKLMRDKDDATALVPLDEYIKAHPTDMRALILRADTNIALGKGVPAVEDLTTVLKLKPDHTWALQLRAETYRRLKKYDLSAKDAHAMFAIKGDPGRILLANKPMAHCLELGGDIKGAIKAREEAVDDRAAFSNVSLTGGDVKNLQPALIASMMEVVKMQIKAKDYAGSLRYLNVMLKRSPSETEALEQRAISLQALGRDKEALADLNKLLAEFPDYRHIYISRAAVHERLGNKAAAKKDRDTAAKL